MTYQKKATKYLCSSDPVKHGPFITFSRLCSIIAPELENTLIGRKNAEYGKPILTMTLCRVLNSISPLGSRFHLTYIPNPG